MNSSRSARADLREGSLGRVLFLSQWYGPEPVSVPMWTTAALRELGWDVVTLTGVHNYPTGKVLPGYRASRRSQEVIDGVPVHRVPLYPSHDASAIRRLLNYLSFALSSLLFGRRLAREADALLVYSSPATAGLLAWYARRRWGKPYVAVVQDLWPDSIYASGFLSSPGLRRLVDLTVGRFVLATYRAASTVVVISPGMRELLIARGVDPERIELIYNWVDEEVFAAYPPDRAALASLGLDHDDVVFMYAGNHGAAQDLGPVVSTFADVGAPAHLVMLGDGIERDALEASVREASNVHFLGAKPLAEVPALMAASDVQIVSLGAHPLFEITMPSKVQAILASGKPALVHAPGDAATIVSSANAGYGVPPGDVAQLRQAIQALCALPHQERVALGARARALYDVEMARSVGATRLSGALSAAAKEQLGADE